MLVIPTHRTKDVSEIDELMKIRQFLVRSEDAAAEPVPPLDRWLLVINHHVARIFRTLTLGSIAENILPRDPEDRSKDFARGGEKPNVDNYFALVAAALKGAGQILVFGSGTGTANEMEQFGAWLNIHEHELAGRTTGFLTIDEHHLTDGELLAKARDFFARPRDLGLLT